MGTGFNVKLEIEGKETKVSVNLVAASSDFNQVIMRAAERGIVDYITINNASSFNMAVDVTYADSNVEITTEGLLEIIEGIQNKKLKKSLEAKEIKALKEAIYKKLPKGFDQPRILNVEYEVTLLDNNGKKFLPETYADNTGPDLDYGTK